MIGSLLVSLVVLLSRQRPALLMNPGFETGLSGWLAEGDVHLDANHPISGKASLRIGPGKGAVRQSYKVPGLRILWFGANLKLSDAKVDGKIRLECLDKRGHVLMNLSAGPDSKNAAGIYLKTHAFTNHVILSIEKGEGGTLVADDVLLTDDDKDRVEHAPTINLEEAMHPFWLGDWVTNESVLMLSRKGGPASGKLLQIPSTVLTVTDATLRTQYYEGPDFTITGSVLTATPGSSIPTMSDKEFATGEFPWTRFDGRHVFVTYEHTEPWKGPVPSYGGDHLPLTMQKLKARRPLTIVAYGDSITLGINVSGFRNVPPYQPPWPSLVTGQLARVYGGSRINLYNTGLGGMTSQWARDNAKDVVASLNPDLVLIAFGMNDFWSLTPALFRANIEAVMQTIKQRRPNCEFILVAPMKFDPDYTADPTYVGNLAGYAGELKKLVGKGVAVLDMTSISDALYKLKSSKDLTTDPMHPDDYLARWYAQGLVKLLTPDAKK